jgi:hypothetical protein
MGREINKSQQFSDKLVKFIPTEMIGSFIALKSVLDTTLFNNSDISIKNEMNTILIICFFILLILTPFYLWIISGVRHKTQLFVATVSFAIWVYSMHGFDAWYVYKPYLVSVIVILWSLIPPLFVSATDKKKTEIPSTK